jgi:hypothetical protein
LRGGDGCASSRRRYRLSLAMTAACCLPFACPGGLRFEGVSGTGAL